MAVSLKDLTERLRDIRCFHFECDDVAEYLCAQSIDAASLAPYVRFEAGTYSRNVVYRDPRFEILVLCWSAGSQSSIHDHGGNRCWLVPQSGAFSVEDYGREDGAHSCGRVRLQHRGTAQIANGDLDARGVDDADIHRVRARSQSISLHVYAYPIADYLVYDADRGWCEARRFVAGAASSAASAPA